LTKKEKEWYNKSRGVIVMAKAHTFTEEQKKEIEKARKKNKKRFAVLRKRIHFFCGVGEKR
jgi:hypothetical protein